MAEGDSSRLSSGGSRVHLIPVGKGTLADGLYVRVTVPEYFERISRARRNWAHPWAEIEKVLFQANQRMAEELQLRAAAQLEESRIGSRRNYSTGRLEATILASENVFNTGRRWGVGVGSWLKASPAKMYWRQIEEGSAVHVGDEIGGRWSDGSSIFGPMRSRRSMDELFAVKADRAPASWTIANPIEAQNYYRDAWRSYNVQAQARAALQQAITSVLGIQFRSSRPTWNTLINSMR